MCYEFVMGIFVADIAIAKPQAPQPTPKKKEKKARQPTMTNV